MFLNDERILLSDSEEEKRIFITVYMSKDLTCLRLMFLVLVKMTLLAYLSSTYRRTTGANHAERLVKFTGNFLFG